MEEELRMRWYIKLLVTPWLRKMYLKYWMCKQKRKGVGLVPIELMEELGEKECIKLVNKGIQDEGVNSIDIGSQRISIIRPYSQITSF